MCGVSVPTSTFISPVQVVVPNVWDAMTAPFMTSWMLAASPCSSTPVTSSPHAATPTAAIKASAPRDFL